MSLILLPNMVTISHIVNKLVDERIYLHEALSYGIASYGSVAKHLKPAIEKELKREVDHFAIVTALRRYASKIHTRFKEIQFGTKYSEVNLKTHIIDINVLRTQELFDKLKRFYDIINFDRGDILHVVYGRTHVSIVTNERYRDKMLNLLQNQKIKKIEENLVALSFTVGKERIEAPGVLFKMTRSLAWENINVIEIISVDLEVTFIIKKEDANRGYNALERLIINGKSDTIQK
jgi:aspartokinase